MHAPTRKIEPFKTQKQSTDKITFEIGRVLNEMGVDKSEYKVLTDWNSNWFGLEFKLYYYPDKEHFMLIRRISKTHKTPKDNAAAVYEWLHNRWMGVIRGLETMEEAFVGMHLSFSESYLPEATVKLLTEGSCGIYQKLLTDNTQGQGIR